MTSSRFKSISTFFRSAIFCAYGLGSVLLFVQSFWRNLLWRKNHLFPKGISLPSGLFNNGLVKIVINPLVGICTPD